MIASGRAVTLALLGLCALVAQVPARAQVDASRTAVIAQSGAKPRPKPLPPPRPYPVRPPPPAPPPKPRPSLMPKVTGLPLAGAEAVLARLGLKPSGVARVASNAQPNTVVDQQPQPGQAVSEASRIVLSVANSAVMVRVPDLRGLTPQQAGPTLRAVGLTPGRQGEVVSSQRPPGRIVGTRPGPRAPAERGSAVDYQVAQAPPPPPAAILPPPRPPSPPSAQGGGGQGEAPRPVTPTPIQPAPVPPAPVQPAPVGRGPPSSAPASSAPESSAPVSSAPTSSAPAPGAPAEAAAPPRSGPPAATGPLD
ncbi:MAG TPA: PASTA domain-containing protein, partial [Caulobacteraceae bacterium]